MTALSTLAELRTILERSQQRTAAAAAAVDRSRYSEAMQLLSTTECTLDEAITQCDQLRSLINQLELFPSTPTPTPPAAHAEPPASSSPPPKCTAQPATGPTARKS